MAGDEGAQLGIYERDPASRGHTVRHVEEFLGHYLVEVAEHRLLQEARVKSCHAVDGMASNAGKMGHAYEFTPGFIDERKSPKQLIIIRKAQPEIIKKTAIYLKNNF